MSISAGVALFALYALVSGIAVPPSALAQATEIQTYERPVRVIIPSIDLDSTIVPMGINSKGELAVPSGTSMDVGWWKDGPTPGDTGSAVLDAHVFAAFAKLKDVPVGANIYVVMSDGSKKRFIVRRSHAYRIENLDSDTLYGDHGTKQLNLITCAGRRTSDGTTYDHRLVVFATYSKKS